MRALFLSIACVALLVPSTVDASTQARGADGFRQGIYAGGGGNNVQQIIVGPFSVDYEIWYTPTFAASSVEHHAYRLGYVSEDKNGVTLSIAEQGKSCGTIVAKQLEDDIIRLTFANGQHIDLSIGTKQDTQELVGVVQHGAQMNAHASHLHDPRPDFPFIPVCAK